MLFRDTAVFALAMLLMGTLLTAGVLAVGMVVSMFFGRGSATPKRRRQAECDS